MKRHTLPGFEEKKREPRRSRAGAVFAEAAEAAPPEVEFVPDMLQGPPATHRGGDRELLGARNGEAAGGWIGSGDLCREMPSSGLVMAGRAQVKGQGVPFTPEV